MNPLTETRERFLLAILAKVPAERIAEIHFFSPIKQGGIESGVAVAAAWPEQVAPAEAAEAVAPTDVVEATEAPEAAAASESTEMSEATELPDAAEAVEPTESVEASDAAEPDEAVETTEPAEPNEAVESTEATDLEAASAEDSEGPSSVPPARHVVYTARYRHVLKGLDRGKWETNVVAEADAPLVTVDAVVRGVQRRSGDVDEPTRMDGEEVREFVARRAAVTTP